MNRYAAALLIAMIVAGLVACESAGDDPAQHERVTKPMPVTATMIVPIEAQVAPQEK